MRTSDLFRHLSGKCLLYFQTKKYNKELFSLYSDRQREKIKNFEKENLCSPILDTVKLRDAVGVLRISRRRTLEWLLWDSETFFERRNDSLKIAIENELEAADRIYLQLQLWLIKSKKFASSFLNQIMKGLLNYDKKIFIEA